MSNCPVYPYEKTISEQESFMLQRLTFEINGYEVLIREFATVDAEFEIDKDKWNDLIAKKAALGDVLRALILTICDHDYNGTYLVDFAAKTIKWGVAE